MNFLTPMSENLLLLSEDFRGGMARGLEPDSGFVSCVCVCVCEKKPRYGSERHRRCNKKRERELATVTR